MFIPFHQLPGHARVWVYPASRNFTDAEQQQLLQQAQAFCTTWQAHGQPVHASAAVLHNSFVILAADDQAQAPTGCSIDASVHFVKQLEQQFEVSFFDRTQLSFLLEGNPVRIPLAQVKDAVQQGVIKPDTSFINTLIQTKAELSEKWVQPAGKSWLAKYFKAAAA